jgi:hypothetical protein
MVADTKTAAENDLNPSKQWIENQGVSGPNHDIFILIY